MEIRTKFNIGDHIFTIAPNTLKMVEIKVSQVTASIHDKSMCIRYYPEEGYNGYEESKCFATSEELMSHVFNK